MQINNNEKATNSIQKVRKTTKELLVEEFNCPDILLTNTFFFHPSKSSGARRWVENKVNDEVYSFFTDLGFSVDGDYFTYEGLIYIDFTYNQSCRHVYKKFRIYDGDFKKKTIRYLYKVLKEKSIAA
jgi:hypothetical protein